MDQLLCKMGNIPHDLIRIVENKQVIWNTQTKLRELMIKLNRHDPNGYIRFVRLLCHWSNDNNDDNHLLSLSVTDLL